MPGLFILIAIPGYFSGGNSFYLRQHASYWNRCVFRMNYRHLLITLLCVFFAAGFGAWAAIQWLETKPHSPTTPPPAAAPSFAQDLGGREDLTGSATLAVPAIVAVKAFGGAGLNANSGSGVIFDQQGLLATNRHVIEGSSRIRITLHNRQEYWGELIAEDPATDLALLKIKTKTDLPYLAFGNSDSLKIGQWLLAIGNPFGLRSTVTAGILSARGRSIDVLAGAERIESFLQTDAAINPGSSGGALVNGRGQLVGINTAILSESGRHEGFNFAIPGNLAKRVLYDLRDFGEVRRATLGAYLQTVNAAQARQAQLGNASGVLITELVSGGAALRSGLEVGDVLLSINSQAIKSAQEMQELLAAHRPGDRIRVQFVRKQRARELTIKLRGKSDRAQLKRVADRNQNSSAEERSERH